MKNTNLFITSIFAITIAIGCGNNPTVTENKNPDMLFANLDTSISPGDDFFNYANGGWFKNNPIPETESRWGIGNMVDNEIYKQLKTVCEDAAKNTTAAKNSSMQMIGDLYASAMDSATIDKEGVTPLADDLKE